MLNASKVFSPIQSLIFAYQFLNTLWLFPCRFCFFFSLLNTLTSRCLDRLLYRDDIEMIKVIYFKIAYNFYVALLSKVFI